MSSADLSFDTHTKYQYRALNPSANEIRLLRLHHSQLSEDGLEIVAGNEPGIHGEIIHVNLDENPKYKALSYTWGSPLNQHYPVFIDGKIFMVRENLWLALQQLERNDSAHIIWIDALCIDQKNIEERNEQVQKMKSIFERAEAVLVWLGPSDNPFPEFQIVRDLDNCRESVERLTTRLQAAGTSQLLESYASLQLKDYWFRIWIVQELTVAKDIVFLCGDDSCPISIINEVQSLFEEMQKGSKRFSKRSLYRYAFEPGDINSIYSNGIAGFRLWQQAFDTEKLTLFKCLLWNEEKKCSDPKDMVYGLAGLVNATSELKINVDYSLSTEEVYTIFASLEIRTSQSLDILTRAYNSDHTYSLPSWVPNWSSTYQQDHYFLWSIDEPEFYPTAAKRTQAEVRFGENAELITIKGVEVEYLTHIGNSTGAIDADGVDPVVSTVLNWCSMFKAERGNRQIDLEAFSRTMRCNNVEPDEIASGDTESEHLMGILGALADYEAQKNPGNFVDPLILDIWTSTVNRHTKWLEADGKVYNLTRERKLWKTFLMNLAMFIWDRRFFFSEHTMGLAPEGAREGDIICVPLGCCCPMILRKLDDHFIVIGEAYVDGYMKGKAIDRWEAGELKLKEYELR